MAFFVLHMFVLLFNFFPPASASQQCRCLPGSCCWPDPEAWAVLNSSIGGRLLQPRPYASSCHDPNFDQLACDRARQLQNNAFHRAEVVGTMQYPDWEEDLDTGRNCPIGNNSTSNSTRSSPCYQGSVSTYAINVSSIPQVQKGVIFAAKHNLRLVIKSTGHDWKGRSTAPGSLSIWMYNLKGIVIEDEFVPQGCSVPGTHAVTAESGVQWSELYRQVGENNRVVVGGMGASVSGAGGYVQGGGHGPLTRTFGLAADNVLEFTVVTADGRVRVANQCQNKDLFFALAGGGGGTYGVVYSATFRTFPPVNIIQTLYVVASLNPVSHRNLIQKFIELSPQMDEDRLAGYFYLYTNYIVLSFLLPNGTVTSAQEAFAPLVTYVNQDASLLTINYSVVPYDSFYDYHTSVLCQANPSSCTDATGFVRRLATRWIPKSLIQQSPELLTETFMELFRRNQSVIFGLFVVGGEVSNVTGKNNSVAGFWRRALWHISLSATWNETTSIEVQREIQRQLTSRNELLRNITPGSGCYMNEADYNEPDWQQSFYGENYGILKSIKKNVDPEGLFVCHHCIGSEEWSQDLNCRNKFSLM